MKECISVSKSVFVRFKREDVFQSRIFSAHGHALFFEQ